MGSIQPEIDRINGAKITLGEYLRAKGITVDASARIDVLAGQLADIASLTLTGITITTPPAKTAYNAGETFDPAGMVVTADFSNGAALAITNYSVPTGALEAGTTSITVSLAFGSETKTATQVITVEKKKSMSYSGTHTTKTITSGGVEYTLYTITGSGTLTVEGTYRDTDVWICGGGANGSAGSSGGAGAYCAQLTKTALSGTYVIAIGASQGATTFGSALSVPAVSGPNGGTGGGAGRRGGAGTGDGQSKYPFADTTLFNCHCAGGGGGGYGTNGSGTSSRCDGGSGGTNGGNGNGTGAYISPTIYNEEESSGGSGGKYGGGRGGNASWKDSTGYGGGSATFYGSGGGGGGYGQHYQTTAASGGAGYQGVVYIRIPAA